METCFCSFFINCFQFVTQCHPCTCTDEWHPTASTLCPLSLPRNKAQAELHSKQSSNAPSPENFLTIGGYFKRCTYHVTALSWLKKEEERKKERKKEDEQF